MPGDKPNIIDYATPQTRRPTPSPVVERANPFVGLLMILLLFVLCLGALGVLWLRSR